ncbi:MAG: hypothetical protein WC823_00400 [Parcubacteria group bacterium]|jgi:hypothetical protein
MVKVTFDYNLEKDAWSWVVIAKDRNVWGLNWRDQIAQIPDELLVQIEKAGFAQAQAIVAEYIKKNVKTEYKNRVMRAEMRALEESWGLVEEKYFEILADIMQKPIFQEGFDCYFTTGLMCPYDEKEGWFMVSMWHSVPFSITTICHEIMHLQFLYYYRDYLEKNGLADEQIEDLKEALTFLLNEPEFGGIILSQDNGYPEHAELREALRDVWSKNKDFQNLLAEAVIIIKKDR